jgi:carboxypeptidase C (cathepsin A)
VLDHTGPERPVTFAFNGGPGSSSVWLHMGLLGPNRVRVDVDRPADVPGSIEANPHTLLTTSDVVFIDPTSTGHSRPVEGKGSEYHGVKADIESVGELIRRWLADNGRFGSPRYLAGESYGTTRAVGVARHLQERWNLEFNGLVLISLALKLGTLLFDDANNWLASVMLLPAAAVTGHYHGKVEADDVWELHERADRFARERYAPALIAGARLSADERTTLSKELAALTGVSAEFYDRCDNHLDLGRFCTELRRSTRQTVGRLDSRFIGYTRDALSEALTVDPSLDAVRGVFTTGLYLQLQALGYEESRSYDIMNRDVWPWTFDDCENKPLDLSGQLRETMVSNPALRVFVASGLYDLATPWAATEYTLAQLQLPAGFPEKVQSHCYPAGHMMYLHEASATQLRSDLESFYQG